VNPWENERRKRLGFLLDAGGAAIEYETAVMTITINLPPDIEASVKTQAAKEGLRIEDYITSLVQEGTQRRDKIYLSSGKSFDEILAPFRRNVEGSGMSDEEMEDLFSEARKESCRTRKERTRG
jgi:hypothetical protein